jgi:multicomponent Na+:H+ antiporter subunit E
MKSLIINLIIAVIWLFLSTDRTLADWIIGFIIGFLVLWIFHPVMGSRQYVRRWFALLRFLRIFLGEFLLANLNVAKAVLFQTRESLYPNFITYDVSSLTQLEILLLSYCITLTPGTTSVDLSGDSKTLIFHALDAHGPEGVRERIKRRLETPLLCVTR